MGIWHCDCQREEGMERKDTDAEDDDDLNLISRNEYSGIARRAEVAYKKTDSQTHEMGRKT